MWASFMGKALLVVIWDKNYMIKEDIRCRELYV